MVSFFDLDSWYLNVEFAWQGVFLFSFFFLDGGIFYEFFGEVLM